MDVAVDLPRSLPPVKFDAWKGTCTDLAEALAAGSGLIALAGPDGSGKTYTLTAFARAPAPPGRRASLRSVWQALDPLVALDLVDDVDAGGLARLDTGDGFVGKRVVAVRPDVVPDLVRVYPDAKVIHVRPMSPRDVRAFVEERRKQLRLPADIFTLRALSALEKACGGRPGRLENLCARAGEAARAENAQRISGDHVEQANRSLPMQPVAWQPEVTRQGALRRDDAPVAHEEGAGEPAGVDERPSASEGAVAIAPVMPRPVNDDTPPSVRSAWEVLVSPPGPAALAKVQHAEFFRGCCKAALIAVAITLPVLTAGYVLTGGLDPVTIAATAAFDRFAAVVNGPAASRLLGSIGTTSRPLPVVANAAPLELDLTGPAAFATPAIQLDADLPPFGMSITAPDLPDGAGGGGTGQTQESAANPEEASGLLAMGKALLATGQMAGAHEMFGAAARMGNLEAAEFVVKDALASASSKARPNERTPGPGRDAKHAETGLHRGAADE